MIGSIVCFLHIKENNWMMLLDVNVTAPLLPQVLMQAVDLPILSESDRPSNQSSPAGQLSGVSKLLSSSERKQPKWFKLGSESTQ